MYDICILFLFIIYLNITLILLQQALEAGLQELERRIDTEFENAD